VDQHWTIIKPVDSLGSSQLRAPKFMTYFYHDIRK